MAGRRGKNRLKGIDGGCGGVLNQPSQAGKRPKNGKNSGKKVMKVVDAR
jgi:hypothetical protein